MTMEIKAENRPLCGTQDGTRYWLNNEPCGLVCGCITYLLILYGQVTATFYVIAPWLGMGFLGGINILLFNSVSFIAMYSHFRAMTTDPGAVPKSARPTPDDQMEIDYEANERWVGTNTGPSNQYRKFCKRCKAFKPIRAHHCSICARCIVKMDHHCPWVNNCVGIGNHKLFLLFLLWIFITCVYALALVIGKYVSCALGRFDCDNQPELANVFTILLIVESALFGIFTLCMMADQSTVLITNETKIDRLKGTSTSGSTPVGFNEVFGYPADAGFAWWWLLPIAAQIPNEWREAILGYRTQEGSSDDVPCCIEVGSHRPKPTQGKSLVAEIAADFELGHMESKRSALMTAVDTEETTAEGHESDFSAQEGDESITSTETNPLLNGAGTTSSVSSASAGGGAYAVSRRAKSN